jgi:tetratricopeptide (TPR) repeat protein
MFKRILSALSGRKSAPSGSENSTHAGAAGATASADDPLTVTVYDSYGRELTITRAQWREKVFLPNLKQKWDDAAELYRLIMSGINDGLAADLGDAADRLVEIDDDPERCHVVQGIVRMKNGQLDLAEATLREGMAKAGETGTLLTNLAKVHAQRGEQELADETLWRAVQADPNQDNGMLWWAAIQRERHGEKGYLDALRAVSALPGSWRAQLWLARHHLESKDVDAARALYGEVLAGGKFDGGALMMISGDLGNNGQVPLMIELIAPVFDEHRHDPMAGMNLLRAYQQLGRVDEGEALLARLYALGLPPLKQHLDQFAQAFQEMRKQNAGSVAIDPANLKIATLTLDRPIWQYGLRHADWLFAQKQSSCPQIGFFVLSMPANEAARAESQREDEAGRLTRAIPLYLAEAVHYWSEYAANTYIQVVEGGGPVVPGGKADGNALFDMVPPAMKYFVTGEIRRFGEGESAEWEISLSLWNCASRTMHACESGRAAHPVVGGLVLALEERLLTHIGMRRQTPLDAFYQRPAADVVPAYLVELGQALQLTLLATGYTPKSSIWGERAMLDWPLNMALQRPRAEVPKLMYFAGLGMALDYGSDVLAEYKERSLQLLRESQRAGSAAYRLAPLVWKIFGMDDELQAYMRSLPPDAGRELRAWVQRVAE